MPDVDDILYLTAEEKDVLFSKLPTALQAGWKPLIRTETSDAYENTEQIGRRLKKSRYSIPAIEQYLQAVSDGKNPDFPQIDLASMSDEAIAEHCYVLGASGLSVMLQMELMDPSVTEEGLEAAAAVSRIRHEILATNPTLPSLK